MHESHLIKNLFTDLLKLGEKHKAKKITTIHLKMGPLSEINPDILRFYFAEHSKGTILDGVEVIINDSENYELKLISFDYE